MKKTTKIYCAMAGFFVLQVVSVGLITKQPTSSRIELLLAAAWVPSEEYENCMAWAFGDDWKLTTIDPVNVPAIWNSRHGDLFIIYGTDPIAETTIQIGRFYISTVYNKTKPYCDPNGILHVWGEHQPIETALMKIRAE